MKFVPLSRRLSNRKSRSSDQREKRSKRSFLHLEGLEDRCTPSILFGNTPGLTTSDNNGPVLSNAQVRLVFWGTGWSSVPTLQAQMQSAVDSLNGSTYFYSPLRGSDLSQYRPGSAARPTRVASFNETDHSPGVTFTANDVVAMLTQDFSSAPGFYYYVIPDPNSNPQPSCGCAAEHTFATISGNRFYFGFSRNLATPSLNDLTYLYSHEMAESITDPDGTALQINPRNPSSWNEICDGEAQNYSYRLNNILAQAYWSRNDGKFTVPTGQSQDFFVSASRVLTVNGDQLSNHNDVVTLDVVSGGVKVTLNGDVAQFDPGAISSVVVNTLTGTNTVNVLRTVVPVTVESGGPDTVNVGVGGSVQGIQAAVTVHNSPTRDALVIDDSTDSGNRTVSVNGSGITISGAAPINTTSFSISTLSLRGGTGNNLYTINGVPAVTSMTLDTGSGADTVNVLATGVPLAVNTTTSPGGGGNDIVNLGNAGSLTGITGAVTILNNPSRDHVNINDSADSANRSVAISANGVTFSGLGAINFTSFSVTTLSVSGGTGANTYTISGTPATTSVTLDTGSGVDTTNVQATSVPTAVNTTTSPGGSNNDVVNIGSAGSLSGIQGAVTILNNPSRDHVVINDSADSSNRSITISVTGVSVSGFAAINFTSFSVNTLTVDGGSGNNTYTLSGSPALTSVTLDTGSGVDTTNVQATSVATAVNTTTSPGGSNNDVVALGNAGSLAGLQGPVTILNNPSRDQVVVDDSADSTGESVAISASGVNVSGSAAINFTSFSVNSLTVNGGSGGNAFAVTGFPAVSGVLVNTGAGGDSVVVSNSGVLDGIGHVMVNDASGTAAVTVDDSAFGSPEDYVMSSTDVTISRTSFFDVSYSGIGSLTLNGGQGSGTFFDIDSTSVATTVNGGAGLNCFHVSPFTQYLAGSIVGPLTLNGSGADILDFFDQNDPASETFTFDATPSTLTISTGTIATFSGISAGGIYVETNGFSTPNDASGTVNFDVPPPCAPGGGSRPSLTPPASSSQANVGLQQSQATQTAQPAAFFAPVHAKAAPATVDYLAILDEVFSS